MKQYIISNINIYKIHKYNIYIFKHKYKKKMCISNISYKTSTVEGIIYTKLYTKIYTELKKIYKINF